MVRFWLFVNKISDNAVIAFHNHFEKYVERDIHSDIAFSGDFKLAFLRTGFLLGKRYIKPLSSLLVLGFCRSHYVDLPMYNILLLSSS